MAIRVLGAYASVNQAPQQLMILSPICDWLVGLIQARQAPNIIASATWTLAILCGETHGESCVDVNVQGTSLFQHLQTKGVVTKLFYLLSTLQAANQRGQVVPECFDPSFVSIYLIEEQPCLMQQDPDKGLKYPTNNDFVSQTCVPVSIICFQPCFQMVAPGCRRLLGEFGNQILWILGTSVGYLLKRVSLLALFLCFAMFPFLANACTTRFFSHLKNFWHFCRHLFQPVQPTTSSDDDSSLGLISDLLRTQQTLEWSTCLLPALNESFVKLARSRQRSIFGLCHLMLAMLQMKRFTTLVGGCSRYHQDHRTEFTAAA